MKLERDLADLTRLVAPAVWDELSRAAALARRKYYTEAGIRLGRAVEAALYCTARELDLEVSDRRIDEFVTLTDQLWQKEAQIIRKKTAGDVERLAEIAGGLTKLVCNLAANADARTGRQSSEPKRTLALLREMSGALGRRSPSDSVALQRHAPLLQEIQDSRNRAAHASISGETRELNAAEVSQMAADASTVIRGLLNIIVGARAATRDSASTT